MSDGRRGRSHEVHEAVIIDFAGGELLATLPHDGAGSGALAIMPAVKHRSARQNDGRNINRGCGHDAGRCGFVAACCQDNAIQWVAV